jgi:hypothetical protein
MNITGTIGRPAPHGPRRTPDMTTATTRPAPERVPGREQDRTRKLQLIPEAMARSHMAERLSEAESQRRAWELASALRMQRRSRRLQRRAERASQRARRALARAVMQ